jgi:PilZ domain
VNRDAADSGAVSMTGEGRKSNRVRFEHFCSPVNIVAIDGTWRRQGLLRDVSATGAQLEIDGTTDVFQAKEFFLLLSSTGAAFRRCELVWINGLTVGVRFIAENKKKKATTAH